jgi:transglutaminase-like putative cysteine protease
MENFLGLTWVIKRLGLSTVLVLSLLALTFTGFVIGLTESVHGLEVVLLLSVAGLAILGGWFIGRWVQRPWLVAALALVIGSFVTLLLVGQLGPQLLTALGQLTLYSLSLLQMPLHSPDVGPATTAVVELLSQTNVLFLRLRDWLSAVALNQPTYDPVAASLSWVFIVWMVTVTAAVGVYQHRPLPGLLPALGLLIFLVAYVGTNAMHLITPLAGLLLLLATSSQRARESRWLRSRIDFAEAIRLDLAVVTFVVSGALVITAAYVPGLSIKTITDWIHDLTTQSNAAGSAAPESLGVSAGANGNSAFDPLRVGGLPQQRLIGSGPELSKEVVMLITPDDPNLNYYWRSAVYNQYTGRGWLTTTTEVIDYRANTRIRTSPLPGQQLARFRVQEVESLGNILYHPGSLITTEADFSIAWRSGSDFFSASVLGSYRAESYVAQPTVSQLQSSISRYPNEILSRYLALPNTLPQRVVALARTLTATERTPYDRAHAIETYLRQYPYTLDLPAPPLNVDVADYFLFDLKRGYCDYYATAMVVLARAAGLPARFVTGYARGTFEPETNRYIVTAAEAHSWVEVYFDEYGWVEFEPTGGRPPIDRVAQSIATPEPTPTEITDRPVLPGLSPVALPILFVLIVLAVAALPVGLSLDRFRLGRLTPQQTVDILFGRLLNRADRLGVVRIQGDTPYEFAQAVRECLTQRKAQAPTREAVDQLVQLYVQACYSPRPLTRTEQRQAIRLWASLNWQLWRVKPI